MLKKRTFDKIKTLLQTQTSFKKISQKTGIEIPVICAISKGWNPDFPEGRPSKSWVQEEPSVDCDRICAVCPRVRAKKTESSISCVAPADTCFLGVFLNPECAARYEEIRRKKAWEEVHEDWMERCFPK